MWTIFKVFTEFVTILVLFYVLVFWGPQAMWDLNSPTRGQTYPPCTGRQSLHHWATREVPAKLFRPGDCGHQDLTAWRVFPPSKTYFKFHLHEYTWIPPPPTPGYTKLSLPWILDQFSNCSMLWPMLEQETATHSSILAWKVLRTEESDGLQSIGSPRIGQDRAIGHEHGWCCLPRWIIKRSGTDLLHILAKHWTSFGGGGLVAKPCPSCDPMDL